MAEESITFLYGINTSARLFHTKDRNVHVQALANLSSSGFKLSQNFSLLRMSHLRAGKKHSRVGFRLVSGISLGFGGSGWGFGGVKPKMGELQVVAKVLPAHWVGNFVFLPRIPRFNPQVSPQGAFPKG